MRLKVKELLEAVSGTLLFGGIEKEFEFVSSNSKENIENRLFIPIVGQNKDGHDYIGDAVKNGAVGYLTQNDQVFPCGFGVKVSDTKKALGDLARYVRDKINPTVIGITGSVGKTTTRQFIAGVVSQLGKTLVTVGNFNNDIGLPLSILSAAGDEKFMVLEMGMNSLGEISYLTQIAKPDIAVITLIGTSHIEYLGSRDNILKAKLEILEGLKEEGKIVFNGDDPILYSLKEKYKPEYYGRNLEIISDKFVIDNQEYEIEPEGRHNKINASSAVLIGKLLGASYEQIKDGLKSFEQIKYRQDIKALDGKTIILDCYNASLDSDLAALAVLREYKGKRKIAVLGGIGELGYHLEGILNQIGIGVFENNIDLLICTDENSNYIKDGAIKAGMPSERIFYFETKEELYQEIDSILKEGDTILIKASRKYKFEEIYEFLKQDINKGML